MAARKASTRFDWRHVSRLHPRVPAGHSCAAGAGVHLETVREIKTRNGRGQASARVDAGIQGQYLCPSWQRHLEGRTRCRARELQERADDAAAPPPPGFAFGLATPIRIRQTTLLPTAARGGKSVWGIPARNSPDPLGQCHRARQLGGGARQAPALSPAENQFHCRRALLGSR